MKRIKYVLVVLTLMVLGSEAMAQRQRDPSKMIAKEKEVVLEKVSDLDESQKTSLDEIYADLETSVKEVMESGNRSEMRSQMEEIHEKKDASIKALFTEAQFEQYQEIMDERHKNKHRPRG